MDYKYKAFISYSHKDAAIAESIQEMLESYRVPRGRRQGNDRKIGKVFRDQSDLPMTDDLPQTICDELNASEYLIVIGSPNAYLSNWVRREIDFFLQNHRRDNVLMVVAHGDPEVVRRQLLPEYAEPYFLDLSQSDVKELRRNRKPDFVRLCAKLLGCNPDDLVRRDQERDRKRRWSWIGGISAVALTIIAILLWSNLQIDAKNRELEQQNQEILVNMAWDQLESGERAEAIKTALRALDGRSYHAPAEEVLIRSLGYFEEEALESMVSKTVLEHVNPVSDFCLSQDGSRLFLIDINDDVVCFDTATGEMLWDQRALVGQMMEPSEGYASPNAYSIRFGDKAVSVSGEYLIIHDYRTNVLALSQQTGELLWHHEDTDGAMNPWRTVYVSGDQNTLAYVEQTEDSHEIIFVDIPSGDMVQRVRVADEDHWNSLGEVPNLVFRGSSADIHTGGALNSDGSKFAGSVVEEYADGSTALCYYLADRNTGECQVISRQESVVETYGFGVSVDFTDDGQTLTVIRTNVEMEYINEQQMQVMNPADPNERFAYTVEKIDLSDHRLLWSVHTPSDPAGDFTYIHQIPRLYLSDQIIINANEYLYALNAQTGVVNFAVKLEDMVLDLLTVGSDSFAVILENGTYTVYRSVQDGVEAAGISHLLGPIEQVESSAHGLIQTADTGSFVAAVPEDQGQCIEISRIVTMDGLHQCVDTGLSSADLLLSDTYVSFPDEDSLLLGRGILLNENAGTGDLVSSWVRGSSYALIDVNTNQVLRMLEIPFQGFLGCLLPGNRILFLYDNTGNLFYYNMDSDGWGTLYEGYERVQDENGEEIVQSLDLISALAVRTSDQAVMDAICFDEEILLVVVDTSQHVKSDTLPYPEDYPNGITYWIDAGCNGYIGMPYIKNGQDMISGCAFLNSLDLQWKMRSFEDYGGMHKIWFSESRDLYAGLTGQKTIDIFEIESGKRVCQIPFALPHSALASVRFLMDDRYLLLQTITEQISICDTSTGEIVYTEWDEALTSTAQLYCVEDPAHSRLYIRKEHNGTVGDSASCIDTRTWTKIADIPGFVTLDPRSNTIYRMVDIPDELDRLVACRLPGTEELISVARQLVG